MLKPGISEPELMKPPFLLFHDVFGWGQTHVHSNDNPDIGSPLVSGVHSQVSGWWTYSLSQNGQPISENTCCAWDISSTKTSTGSGPPSPFAPTPHGDPSPGFRWKWPRPTGINCRRSCFSGWKTLLSGVWNIMGYRACSMLLVWVYMLLVLDSPSKFGQQMVISVTSMCHGIWVHRAWITVAEGAPAQQACCQTLVIRSESAQLHLMKRQLCKPTRKEWQRGEQKWVCCLYIDMYLWVPNDMLWMVCNSSTLEASSWSAIFSLALGTLRCKISKGQLLGGLNPNHPNFFCQFAFHRIISLPTWAVTDSSNKPHRQWLFCKR